MSASVKSNLNPNEGPGHLGRLPRPLPLVTIENSFFWEAGKFGELRFQKCRSCRNLRFPIAPICPYCRSTETEIVSVSGRALVVGSTVNHQAWSSAIDPPIPLLSWPSRRTLASGSPRISPVARPMRCISDSGSLSNSFSNQTLCGSAVLTDRRGHGDWLVPEPIRASRHNTVVKDLRFRSRSAITGVGMSEVGRRLMRPPLALALEASLRAIEDAGVSVADIDGVSTYPGGPGSGGHGEGGTTPVIDALRLQPTWINGGERCPARSVRWWRPCWRWQAASPPCSGVPHGLGGDV